MEASNALYRAGILRHCPDGQSCSTPRVGGLGMAHSNTDLDFGRNGLAPTNAEDLPA